MPRPEPNPLESQGDPSAGGGGAPGVDPAAIARDHAVLAAALDPIVTIDGHGVIQSVSDSVERVFGWKPRELVGRNVSMLMPEPYRSAHNGHLAQFRRTGISKILGRSQQIEAVRKSGERFAIEISTATVHVGAGGTPLYVGIIRDIGDSKRMERELRLIQDLALSISKASNLGAALVETLRQICLVTGWDYGEAWVPAADGDDLVGAESWMRPGSGLERFAETMKSTRFRHGLGLAGAEWGEGRPIWLGDAGSFAEAEFCRPAAAKEAGLRAAAYVPILSEDRPLAVMLFFVRATGQTSPQLLELVRAAVAPLGTLIRRRQAEDELAEYRRRLEEMVDQRTRALHESEDRLRLADRLASIGTLAAGLGHDMNNVLLPVRAHLNALRASGDGHGGLPSGARRHVDAVRKSVAYLQQLADGLHYLATDPDKESSTTEVVRLAEWWSQAGVLIAKAVPRHVRVIAKIPASLPPVRIGAPGLTQAVLNLVVNAGEAIPPPQVRKRRQGLIRVWAALEAGGACVRLGVTDNGLGMTEEVRRRAFEMFFTTKSRGLGTGLGLPLVRKVVDSAEGSVEIETEVGKGTTITMLLPAMQGSAGSLAESPLAVVSVGDGRAAALMQHILEASGARVEVGRDVPGAQILIVDPDAVNLPCVQGWRETSPRGRLVLFGEPEAALARSWDAYDPIVIKDRYDFEAVRTGLGRALAPT